MNRNELVRSASTYGLVLRGGFRPAADDCVPEIQPGQPPLSLVLFGNAGSSIWQAFSTSSEFEDKLPDPLDRWSKRVGEALAKQWQGKPLFPFGGPPWHPFTRWAQKAEGLQSSRLGMLIHPQFGLWHAYRFAIAFPTRVEGLEEQAAAPRACDSCSAEPCLGTCPVEAFDGEHYDVASCYTYLQSHPEAPCHRGCLARGACPEGGGFRYRDEHAAFHMERFYLAQRCRRGP